MRTLIVGLLLSQLVWAQPALKSLSIYEKKPTYTIAVKYPGPNAAALRLVSEEIAAFKKEEMQPGCVLEINYEVVYSSPKITSLLFSGYANLGGAHPNGIQKTLLLSSTGQPLSLRQCLRGNGWLKALETYCRQDLQRQKLDSDKDWILTGTAGTPENYQRVLPTSKGLRVFFADYQVAPHALGPQEVMVPYSVVAPYINPKGPLAGL